MVSRKGRKEFHAKSAKGFTQRAQSFHAMVFLFFACFARSSRALREKNKSLLIYNIITLNSFTQRAQRISRKGRKGFHAKGAKGFTQRAQRVSRKERKEF